MMSTARQGWRCRPRLLGKGIKPVVGLAVVALAAAACGSGTGSGKGGTTTSNKTATTKVAAGQPSTGSSSGSLTFYMVTHACPSDSFWPPVFNGAKAAAASLGVTLHIVSLTSAQCGSIPAEVTNFQTALSAHPDGIAVTVTSATAFSAALKKAQSENIPVVAVNTVPSNNNPSVNPYLAYVGQGNYQAGVGAGKEAASLFKLHSGDLVAVVDHEPYNISLTAREKGIAAGLSSAGIKPVDVNTTDNPSQGATTVGAYITKNPNVKALLSLGSIGTTQIVTAIKQSGSGKKIHVGAFDLGTATLHYIEQGQVGFTVDQQPFLEGYYSVVELYTHDRYGSQPEDFSTGPAYLTSKNVKSLGKYVKQTGF